MLTSSPNASRSSRTTPRETLEAACDAALKRVEQAARDGANLMPPFIEAVTAYATLGEIVETLKGVYGEYVEPIII